MKLRISDHKLNIETGRYNKISRCDRICPVCSLDNEDEIHFLLDCAKYSSIRDDFFNKIANRIPNYKHIPISTLIIQLMNSTDYYLNKQLVQYVTSCLETRDNLLSKAWYCYLIYFLLLLLLKCFCNGVSLFYGHANKAHCCCCCCCPLRIIRSFSIFRTELGNIDPFNHVLIVIVWDSLLCLAPRAPMVIPGSLYSNFYFYYFHCWNFLFWGRLIDWLIDM